MVPIAPSATMTRRDNCSRNAWALVVVVLVMRKRSQWRSGMQDCASYDFSAGGPGGGSHAADSRMQGQNAERSQFAERSQLPAPWGQRNLLHLRKRRNKHADASHGPRHR